MTALAIVSLTPVFEEEIGWQPGGGWVEGSHQDLPYPEIDSQALKEWPVAGSISGRCR